jgi:hypothetical protein
VPIIITLPDQTGFYGVGVQIHGFSDLAQLVNPPYHWNFRFSRAEDNLTRWSQTITTDTNVVDMTIGFSTPLQEPQPLVFGQTQIPNQENTKLELEIRDDVGAQVDVAPPLSLPWNSTVGLAYTNYLLSQDIIRKATAGGSSDKLDQILAAVYRTWPGA